MININKKILQYIGFSSISLFGVVSIIPNVIIIPNKNICEDKNIKYVIATYIGLSSSISFIISGSVGLFNIKEGKKFGKIGCISLITQMAYLYNYKLLNNIFENNYK